jgi:hypothetical protein
VTNGRIGNELTSHIGIVDNDHRRTARGRLRATSSHHY